MENLYFYEVEQFAITKKKQAMKKEFKLKKFSLRL